MATVRGAGRRRVSHCQAMSAYGGSFGCQLESLAEDLYDVIDSLEQKQMGDISKALAGNMVEYIYQEQAGESGNENEEEEKKKIALKIVEDALKEKTKKKNKKIKCSKTSKKELSLLLHERDVPLKFGKTKKVVRKTTKP